MIRVGSPSIFSLESSITEVYSEPGSFALGYFLIYINGCKYGVCSPDATLLACSVDEVKTRCSRKGQHQVEFSKEENPYDIAEAIYSSIYRESPEEKSFFGLMKDEIAEVVYQNRIMWAPDGDQAFDDGSYVLHFDVFDQVRLIGFRADSEYNIENNSLSEVWIENDKFYELLSDWVNQMNSYRENSLDS